jgi:hypothetical protein
MTQKKDRVEPGYMKREISWGKVKHSCFIAFFLLLLWNIIRVYGFKFNDMLQPQEDEKLK